MTFGEHTTYQGDSVPEGLKQDRFFMNQQNSGLLFSTGSKTESETGNDSSEFSEVYNLLKTM